MVCWEAVKSYGGRVTHNDDRGTRFDDRATQYEDRATQFVGDGVMTFFGYPIAHEDDDVRATRSALRIIEEIKRINRETGEKLGVELRVRVGLHTGEAVVGERGPSGSYQLFAVGESVSLASRIQNVAAPNTVLVSPQTAKAIAGHFQMEEVDPQPLKGFDEKIPLFRVVAATGARTKLEAAARGQLTPRVGRESEMATIASCWTEVQKGASRVLVVRGEAGIGKSRLIHDFKKSALATGTEVFECFCARLTDQVPLAPIIEMLNAQVAKRVDGEATADARRAALDRILREQGCSNDVLPLMCSLLSIPGADEDRSGISRRAAAARGRSRRSRAGWRSPLGALRWPSSSKTFTGPIRRRWTCWI